MSTLEGVPGSGSDMGPKSTAELARMAFEDAQDGLTNDEAGILMPISAKSEGEVAAYVLQHAAILSPGAKKFLAASMELKKVNRES